MPTVFIILTVISFLIIVTCLVSAIGISIMQDKYKDKRLTKLAILCVAAAVMEGGCWLLAMFYVLDHCM